MKPKQEERPAAIAERCFARSETWAGWAGLASLFWVLLVLGSVNSLIDTGWRMPGPRWGVIMFVVTSLTALFWYLAARALRRAHDARVEENRCAAVDYAALLKEFMPTHEEVNVRLAKLAYAAKDACDAEREHYESGNHFTQQESDPEKSLEQARSAFQQQAASANARVKERLAAFWNLHRLIQKWLPYQLLDSWKPYLTIARRHTEEISSSTPISGSMMPPGMHGIID